MTQSQALNILKMGHNIFLTGAPGTGKTYVINQYIDWLHKHDISVAVTASTGIAATHIGGMTIHSWSGIGIKDYLSEWDIESMLEKQYLWKRFNNTEVLIIDEISMLSAVVLDSLDMLARNMRNNPEPFGGMQVVLVGDFFQLPPIGSDANYAFYADVWKQADIHVCYLEQSYRHDEGPLQNLLCQIREQEFDSGTHEILASCESISVDGVEPTRLYTHNVDVDEINEQKLSELDTPLQVFSMTSKGSKKNVETLKKSLLAPEELRLKEGALVMFVKNNPEEGFVNGTLGRVAELDGGVTVETMDGDTLEVQKENWAITNDDGKVLAEVTQYPLRLAWAITVHKSQGMTLDAAEIDLSKCFAPGQGYVALSRVRTMSGIKLVGYNDHALLVDQSVIQQDIRFKNQSERLVCRLEATDTEIITKRHNEFIEHVDGSIDEVEPKQQSSSKVSTYEETKKLLDKQLSIEEMAKERDLTKQTIFNHLQTLRDNGELSIDDITYLRPDQNTFDADIKRVQVAINKAPDDKLSTLKHDMLDDRYSYDNLKLIRLFCEPK